MHVYLALMHALSFDYSCSSIPEAYILTMFTSMALVVLLLLSLILELSLMCSGMFQTFEQDLQTTGGISAV